MNPYFTLPPSPLTLSLPHLRMAQERETIARTTAHPGGQNVRGAHRIDTLCCGSLFHLNAMCSPHNRHEADIQ